MAERQRVRLVAPLVNRPVGLALPFRNPTPDDLPNLAELMLSAYEGTIDYGGETLDETVDEVRSYFEGRSGEPLLDCSFVALDLDAPVSACLISLWEGGPLLAYTYTGKLWKGQGLATGLVQLSINALHARGQQSLALWVTVGNAPAEHVYARLGFQPA